MWTAFCDLASVLGEDWCLIFKQSSSLRLLYAPRNLRLIDHGRVNDFARRGNAHCLARQPGHAGALVQRYRV
jgi:hypothetical protein